MKIPDKIKVKGIEYDIKFEDLENKLFGDYVELPSQIRINTRATKEYQEMTLLHEIIHILRSDIKEQWVKEFAWDLWLVLKDNNLLKEGD